MSPPSRSQEPNEGAVEAILAQLERWEGEERDVEQSLNQRASWLLGFCGIILGLAATQAREVLLRSDELGDVGRLIAVGTLGLGVVLVAASALVALRVVRGERATAIALEEVEHALDDENLIETKAFNQLRDAEVLRAQIPVLRKNNIVRAAYLVRAFVVLRRRPSGSLSQSQYRVRRCFARPREDARGARRRRAFLSVRCVDQEHPYVAHHDHDGDQPVRRPACPQTTTIRR